MPWLIAILIIVSLFFVGVGMKQGFGAAKSIAQVTAQKVSKSSRPQIKAMLQRIESEAAPARKMGAMCYDQVMSSDYLEYVCPIDGQKSVYGMNSQEENAVYGVVKGVDELRRMVTQLNSLTTLASFKLDEKRLCHTHSPDLRPGERYVTLMIEYPDKSKYSYEKVELYDLQMLIGFFGKDLSYKTFNDGTIPLKGETEKIRKILGIEPKENKK
jgi:hypothetical protein